MKKKKENLEKIKRADETMCLSKGAIAQRRVDRLSHQSSRSSSTRKKKRLGSILREFILRNSISVLHGLNFKNQFFIKFDYHPQVVLSFLYQFQAYFGQKITFLCTLFWQFYDLKFQNYESTSFSLVCKIIKKRKSKLRKTLSWRQLT